MNLLSDVITYIRRIVKVPSNSSLSDSLIIDYINRFWIMDVDARMQLFDLKTKYSFQTTPGIVDYNMPLYTAQTAPADSGQVISPYPVYQGFSSPCYVNGIQTSFNTQRDPFLKNFPAYVQSLGTVDQGDGSTTEFTFDLPFFPAIPGHVDMMGIASTGASVDPLFGTSLVSIPSTSVTSRVYLTFTDAQGKNVIVSDSGQFLSSGSSGDLYGLLMRPGNAPYGDVSLGTYSTSSNTVNYNTGEVNVTFPSAPPDGTPIQAQCYFYNQGIPRGVLYYNNTISVFPPPDTQYLVELDAYLSPAAFLSSSAALPFGYMSEYLARGAARKILSDTGDVEQFMFYEPLFKEQEMLVWKRSQRQFTSTRTNTIFSDASYQSSSYNIGQGT